MVTINDESQQCYYAANFTLKMLWQGGRDVVAAEQQVQQGQRELLQGDSVTPNHPTNGQTVFLILCKIINMILIWKCQYVAGF